MPDSIFVRPILIPDDPSRIRFALVCEMNSFFILSRAAAWLASSGSRASFGKWNMSSPLITDNKIIQIVQQQHVAPEYYVHIKHENYSFFVEICSKCRTGVNTELQ